MIGNKNNIGFLLIAALAISPMLDSAAETKREREDCCPGPCCPQRDGEAEMKKDVKKKAVKEKKEVKKKKETEATQEKDRKH